MWKKRWYIRNNIVLKNIIMHDKHNSKIAGHFKTYQIWKGYSPTTIRIKWKKMSTMMLRLVTHVNDINLVDNGSMKNLNL